MYITGSSKTVVYIILCNGVMEFSISKIYYVCGWRNTYILLKDTSTYYSSSNNDLPNVEERWQTTAPESASNAGSGNSRGSENVHLSEAYLGIHSASMAVTPVQHAEKCTFMPVHYNVACKMTYT